MTAPLNVNTPELCIRMAMEDAQLLEDGDNPTGEDYAKYLPRLNSLIQAWQVEGLKLFLWKDVEITLRAGQQDYLFTPGGDVSMLNPLQMRECYYRDPSGTQRPLNPMSWNEWELLSQPGAGGAINSFKVDKQATVFRVSFWMVPDTNSALGTCHMLVRQRAAQVIALNEQLMFPSEWFIALHWGLSSEICMGQPASVIQRCDQKAAYYKEMLEGFDVEEAPVTFEPDPRYMYAGSRFR